jgi:Zn-dependent protease
LIAVIAQLAGWKTFAMMSVLYALFNLLPFHELTGTKIFFGSIMLWIFAAIFTIAIFILIGIAGTTGQMFTVLIAAAIVAIVAVILFYLFYEA